MQSSGVEKERERERDSGFHLELPQRGSHSATLFCLRFDFWTSSIGGPGLTQKCLMIPMVGTDFGQLRSLPPLFKWAGNPALLAPLEDKCHYRSGANNGHCDRGGGWGFVVSLSLCLGAKRGKQIINMWSLFDFRLMVWCFCASALCQHKPEMSAGSQLVKREKEDSFNWKICKCRISSDGL